MRDGVRLAVDLYRPAVVNAGEKLPTLVYITRYWRDIRWRRGFAFLGAGSDAPWRFMTARGYAVLTVDARGTGASFGSRRHEWDKEEVLDGYDLAAWIVAQPWSNGRIGALGTSYSGTTAELFTVPNHPAVKAVIPRFNEFDPYTDIAFPGGLYLSGFVEAWSGSTAALDNNRLLPSPQHPLLERLLLWLGSGGVKPVDADQKRRWLPAAIAAHQPNRHARDNTRGLVFRDDVIDGVQTTDYSVYAYRQQIEASGAALYGWGGWFDAVTADAVICRWQTVQVPQMAIIGAWNHGAGQHASPYAPRAENVTEHWHDFLRFFDHYLKGIDTGVAADVAARCLYYFTIGEEAWKSTTVFPPAGVQPQMWYFGGQHTLSTAAPATAGHDAYRVDFTATTGRTNRWYTQAGGGMVSYPDRAAQDEKLLCYTSAPLEQAIEITGYPVLVLHVAADRDDAAFFAYLEAVEPDGRVIYLTEGQLRALHRKVSTEPPLYARPVPYHSFKRADGELLTPGTVTEVRFGLLPISALIRKGARLRVALAGADAGLFPRLPAQGDLNWTIERSPGRLSGIMLPVIERGHV
ncbi:MAG: CocE/NonD family hydrolase [Anaerolineae bacterium]|nr:CocE/NonD family hydrolase [Anaerolineae bacterium]